uniref:Protein phosphatase 4 regulatory subunit 1 n=1 Tax=Molossus molossus TaxID=27622 RepID=A0A7J8HJ64_MOLMO|nr:hypothetical protein HJG59_014718 [Molossus molossus]
MAEIPLYFVDLQDDLDDYGFEDYGPDCDSMRVTAFLDIPGQDNLPPLTRLEKYAFSDNVFNRQIIARGLLDIFRDFSNDEEDFLTVMAIVVRLSEDAEPTVRTELMEQIPPVAVFLQENRSNFPMVFSEYLIPIVVRYLTDPNNQVRKSSQEVLLILLEQDLIFQHDVENKVCPILLALSAPDSDDEYKAEAVNNPGSGPCSGTSGPLGMEQRPDPAPLEESRSKLQDIIPQPLLDEYVSMTDPARAQTVDNDIAKHCAYSLPGVALTLGRQNWHCLKDTYATLASDGQWKVRRTLAFSIHELAVILGDQLTAADLVPIFNGFLKDLDEVRIGILKHLYDFLKLLHEDKRREYLYQLQEFVVTDNSRNWRFRYELAEQLILILELYNPSDVHDYLMHLALKLCADKVSEVRWISFKLVVAILQKFYSSSESALGLNFINELIVRFRHCSKWVGRQAFAFICQAVVREECIPVDQFVEHLLPSLLSLASDPVPNVRVLLAKALRQTLLDRAYFRNVGHPHLEIVEETVLALQSDRDQDVSFFATLEPKRQNLLDTATLEKQD